jgi:hypothetical protein
MKAFLAGVKRWYLRRFRGIVKPPAHAKGQGTTWQQHPGAVGKVGTFAGWSEWFRCQCGESMYFTAADLKIISQEHVDGCDGWSGFQPGSGRCNCPVTEARYVKICPQCRMGHWKQAK